MLKSALRASCTCLFKTSSPLASPAWRCSARNRVQLESMAKKCGTKEFPVIRLEISPLPEANDLLGGIKNILAILPERFARHDSMTVCC